MGEDAQWDLFRTFEAVARCGTFTAAARSLGLSQSTVSRHLAQLEGDAGSPLLLRGKAVTLTERGVALLGAVQPMVSAATAARAALEQASAIEGQVTLTTVGEVARWVLAPRLDLLYRAHPHLRLRLLASNQVHSLAADEADLALRMARPGRGELVARKLAVESFALFASPSLELHRETPWLGLTGSLATISEQRHAERAFARPARLLVEDLDTLGAAIAAGLGVGILPCLFAARLPVVEVRPGRVGARDLGPVPSRALWLLVHRSKRHLPRVRAVMDWVTSAVGRGASRPSSGVARRPAGPPAPSRTVVPQG